MRAASSNTGAYTWEQIPLNQVERVEVVRGPRASVYGSDAIAGVVNFITRKNYTGLEMEAGYAVTEQGDANSWDFNLAWGHDFADGRGTISLYAALLDRDPLFAGEREFTRVAYVDDWEGKVNAWPLDEGLIDYTAASYGGASDENPFYTANIIASPVLTMSPPIV